MSQDHTFTTEAIIRLRWFDKSSRTIKTSILAYIDNQGRTIWNRSHNAQPEELWKQPIEEMTDDQLLYATRTTGEALGLGWIDQEDADILLDNLNAEILKRHERLTKPRRRAKTEPNTIPAPMITNEEAAENLKKGKKT